MKNSGAISSKDISIIVQGPVFHDGITARCLKSLRAHLPEAEIILSTWKGSNVADLKYDRLVENQDPGPIWILNPFLKKTEINNINRQIASTAGGLNVATRKYALKFRTDFLLRGAQFLDHFDQHQKRSLDFKVFEQRILACTISSRNPHRNEGRFLFHPSDMVLFGLTADLLKLWQPTTIYQTTTLTDSEREWVKADQTVFTRLYPEQCLWIGYLSRYFPELNLSAFWHTSPELLDQSEAALANNFVLLQPRQWPAQWSRTHSSNDLFASLLIYSHADWCVLYLKYCAPGARIPSQLPARIKTRFLPLVGRCESSVKFRWLIQPVFGLLSRLLIRWKI